MRLQVLGAQFFHRKWEGSLSPQKSHQVQAEWDGEHRKLQKMSIFWGTYGSDLIRSASENPGNIFIISFHVLYYQLLHWDKFMEVNMGKLVISSGRLLETSYCICPEAHNLTFNQHSWNTWHENFIAKGYCVPEGNLLSKLIIYC